MLDVAIRENSPALSRGRMRDNNSRHDQHVEEHSTPNNNAGNPRSALKRHDGEKSSAFVNGLSSNGLPPKPAVTKTADGDRDIVAVPSSSDSYDAPPRPASATSNAYNSMQRQRPLTSSSAYGMSPSRYGYLAPSGCPVFRPSAVHLDKLGHEYRPDEGTHRCCNHSEVDGESPSRLSDFRPFSTTSNSDSLLSTAHSVGAREMLRYRARLKAQTPSALAVQTDLEKLKDEQNEAKKTKLEYRERWRASIDQQLQEKEDRLRREKQEGLSQRVQLEDQAEIERCDRIRKRQEQARAIQLQKARDDRLQDISKMSDLQRKKQEREAAIQARKEEEERIRELHESKVRSQREFLQRAMSAQRQQHDEERKQKLNQKRSERELADAVKEADDLAKAAAKADYRHQQEELLEQSRAQHLRKTLRDTRMQMDEEKGLQRIREENERDYKLAAEREAAKKRFLADQLKKQVDEREAAKSRERAQQLAAQQRAIEDSQRAEREAVERERAIRTQKKMMLQYELEEQMSFNNQKTLVDIAME